MHRHIAERILNYAGYYSWGTDPDPWGEPILAAYWDHEDLGPQLRDLKAAWQLLAEEEKTPPLSGQQANLIVGHEPLVQKTAAELSAESPRAD